MFECLQQNDKKEELMALPIAPTPILTGKNAIAMERYMRESKVKKDRLFEHKINFAEIDRLIAERKKAREESAK